MLWAGPLNVLLAHGGMVTQAELDATEQALLLPVTVTRGAVADGVEISLRATRDGPAATGAR